MRIVSLLPAATEWICAFGAEADLVGRSHACDFPPSVSALPVLTRSTVPSQEDSLAIDTHVQDRVQQGLSLYEVDLPLLKSLKPDLVVTQAQCDVCAVSMPHLEADLAAWTGGKPEIFSMEPYTLRDALTMAMHLGRAIGRIEATLGYVGEEEERLDTLRKTLGFHKRSDPSAWPTVVCVEWIEPLMSAGHWMPDIVNMAGGRALLTEKETPSKYISWEALREADPDVLAVMACGFALDQTRRDMTYLTEKEGWNELKAVREGRVYLFDGNAYFNRPGPRLYRSIELMAAVLYPEKAGVEVAPWEMEVFAAKTVSAPEG